MASINFDIAKRYLLGKKSTNSINIITGISIFGISIGTAALILILSVFNGFEQLFSVLFNPFHPDIKVTPINGKFFDIDSSDLYQIEAIEGIEHLSKTIEEVALFEYKNNQEIGTIKGVDENYLKVTQLDTAISQGQYGFKGQGVNFGLIGFGLRNKMSLNIEDRLTPINIFMPLRKKKMAGAKEYTSRSLYTGGVFDLRSDDAYRYVLSSYEFASQLIQKPGQISALEIKINKSLDESKIQSQIQKILGSEFEVKNRYQQDEATLKIMQIEKWISFLIVGLVMVLIAFNLVGALWMIVLDKKKDISVLKALGYNQGDVKSLFIYLGLFITLIGIITGFALGLFLYFLQKNYGLIGINEGFLIDAYPVQLKITDFIVVTLLVLTIGILASILPAGKASSSEMILKGQ